MSEVEKIKIKKPKANTNSIFNKTLITKNIPISIKYIGGNIKLLLERQIKNELEGKCIVEGFVNPESTQVISYSSGEVKSHYIYFDVVVECEICSPVEGMLIDCVAKNITESSGIRAETATEPSPVVIYIARDHFFKNESFKSVKVGDPITVRVIGQRFELNDKYIAVIAELVDKNKKIKKKLVIK